MAIHQAVNKKAPLIVKDDNAREKILLFAKNMSECTDCKLVTQDCKALTIYTFKEFLDRYRSGAFKDKEIVIDDCDLLISQLLHLDPDKITITTR